MVLNQLYDIFFREAAEDAGFDVLRVISQPAAAALAYGKVNRNFFSVIMGQMTFTAQQWCSTISGRMLNVLCPYKSQFRVRKLLKA